MSGFDKRNRLGSVDRALLMLRLFKPITSPYFLPISEPCSTILLIKIFSFLFGRLLVCNADNSAPVSHSSALLIAKWRPRRVPATWRPINGVDGKVTSLLGTDISPWVQLPFCVFLFFFFNVSGFRNQVHEETSPYLLL